MSYTPISSVVINDSHLYTVIKVILSFKLSPNWLQTQNHIQTYHLVALGVLEQKLDFL